MGRDRVPATPWIPERPKADQIRQCAKYEPRPLWVTLDYSGFSGPGGYGQSLCTMSMYPLKIEWVGGYTPPPQTPPYGFSSDLPGLAWCMSFTTLPYVGITLSPAAPAAPHFVSYSPLGRAGPVGGTMWGRGLERMRATL
eukprot:gene12165-biopygen12461